MVHNIFFIECNIKSKVFENSPVNLVWCKNIRLIGGESSKPGIRFNGCDTDWTFESKTERDSEYKSILTLIRESKHD